MVIYLLHGSGGVGEIKYGLIAAARGGLYKLTSDLTTQKNCKVKSHVCCDSHDTFTFTFYLYDPVNASQAMEDNTVSEMKSYAQMK